MKQKNQKLVQFAGIFAACAVILFILMQDNINQARNARDNSQRAFDDLIMTVTNEIEHLKSQLENNPDSVDIFIQIGNRYFDINQPQSAVEFYEKALKTDSLNPSVLTDCAAMYYRLGEDDKALQYLDKAIALKPDLVQAYFNKGLILMQAQNKPAEAIAVWEKYIEIAPESEHAEFLREQIKVIKNVQND